MKKITYTTKHGSIIITLDKDNNFISLQNTNLKNKLSSITKTFSNLSPHFTKLVENIISFEDSCDTIMTNNTNPQPLNIPYPSH